MKPDPDERQTRLFRTAVETARGGTSYAWQRPDGSISTTWRRHVRGYEIVLRIDAESTVSVRSPDAGALFEARFDLREPERSCEILRDDPGGWERILLAAAP